MDEPDDLLRKKKQKHIHMFDALRGADVPLNYVMNFYRAARIKQM